jgi:hypothetical protein
MHINTHMVFMCMSGASRGERIGSSFSAVG